MNDYLIDITRILAIIAEDDARRDSPQAVGWRFRAVEVLQMEFTIYLG